MEQGRSQTLHMQLVRVPSVHLERFTGEALGDLTIVCTSCGKAFSDIDKLGLIVRNTEVIYKRGHLAGFCDLCSSAVTV